MEPRPEGRGNELVLSMGVRDLGLQWSRVPKDAETENGSEEVRIMVELQWSRVPKDAETE